MPSIFRKLLKDKAPETSELDSDSFASQYHGDPVTRVDGHFLDDNTVAYFIHGPDVHGLPMVKHFRDAIRDGTIRIEPDDFGGTKLVNTSRTPVWIPKGVGLASPNTPGYSDNQPRSHQQSRMAVEQGYLILSRGEMGVSNLSCVAPNKSGSTSDFVEQITSRSDLEEAVITAPPTMVAAAHFGGSLTFQRNAVLAAFGMKPEQIYGDDLGALLRSDSVRAESQYLLKGLNEHLRHSWIPGVHAVTGIVVVTLMPNPDGTLGYVLTYDHFGRSNLAKAEPIAVQGGIATRLAIASRRDQRPYSDIFQLMSDLGGPEFIEEIVRAGLASTNIYSAGRRLSPYIGSRIEFKGLKIEPAPYELSPDKSISMMLYSKMK